ncbi:hypothetical protein T06_4648 [Trichinella sp. T6]|nr:hypothetical protein T06_4648 [Trichinella sp. T6]
MAVLFMNQFLLIRCDYLFAFQENYLCHIHYNYKIVDINIMISSFIFSGFWQICHHLCYLLKKQRPKQCTVYKIWHFIIDFNPKNQFHLKIRISKQKYQDAEDDNYCQDISKFSNKSNFATKKHQ